MKLKFLIVLCTFAGYFQAFAQIPNNSFETWTGTDIDAWVNTNKLMALPGNTQSVFKSSDAHSGAYACEMKGTKVVKKPGGVFVPDYVGSIFVGKQILFDSYRGFPYSNKPAQLEFWYKFQNVGSDTANALIYLTRWNTTNGSRDTIAQGIFGTGTSVNSYQKASVTLNYNNANTPDTAILLFSAITINATQEGSSFIIDDLAFTGGNVGINQAQTFDAFEVYPNPSIGKIFISSISHAKSLQVNFFDLQGKSLLCKTTEYENTLEIDLGNLPAGMYLLQIKSGEGVFYRKIELNP